MGIMSDDPLDLDTGLPARIAADAAVLSPTALSVARWLRASTDGVMWIDLAKVARELGVDVAAIKEALEQLQRRGHLIVEHRCKSTLPGDARQLDLFAKAARRARVGYRFGPEPSLMPARRRAPLVVPFPRRHDHGFVKRQAERMSNLSRSDAAKYLRDMMQAVAIDLRRKGIAEKLIEREIDMLSAAIKAVPSFRSLLTPDDKEPA